MTLTAAEWVSYKYSIRHQKDWDAWQSAVRSPLFKSPYTHRMEKQRGKRQKRS